MTTTLVFLASLCLFNVIHLHALSSSCNGPCNDLNDCQGQLICINGKCNDDPDVGTHICGGGSGGGDTCPPSSGSPSCNGGPHPQTRCSPKVSSSTPALLTFNNFDEGGDGGDPSECDNKYHHNSERVVALSTGWYNQGSRCNQMIRITAKNGRSVTAKVVDECDSVNGCDKAHDYQPPCRNNIVDGSQAVWDALGLNTDDGVVDVTWSMA
ncbi:hypothetical protein RIF29_27636 [Crotalaria pallida]|uniref:Kiwellin n=1 Tax=Crotalaria pallida TaxID=3830 RepID=A0AAN9EPY6_CROPI